jgi:hypothetical protein
LNVVAETPEPAQGETAEKPMPAPNASNMRVKAAAATAPAAMAAQDTADVSASSETVLVGAREVVSMMVSRDLD